MRTKTAVDMTALVPVTEATFVRGLGLGVTDSLCMLAPHSRAELLWRQRRAHRVVESLGRRRDVLSPQGGDEFPRTRLEVHDDWLHAARCTLHAARCTNSPATLPLPSNERRAVFRSCARRQMTSATSKEPFFSNATLSMPTQLPAFDSISVQKEASLSAGSSSAILASNSDSAVDQSWLASAPRKFRAR
jgi:hypothetical protein